MNIALLIETLDAGGAERIVCQLAAALVKRGCNAFVYCLKSAGEPGALLGRRGVVVREAHSFGRDPLLAWRLARWMIKDRIHVANTQSSAATVWALPAAKLLRVPLLQTRHGVLLGPATRYPRLADRFAHLIDRVGIVAETLRETLPAGRVAREAVYLPNCVDRAPLPRAEARNTLQALCGHALDGPVVLTVGTICAEKDTCGLLHAMAILRQERPDARLVWAGPVRGETYGAAVRRVERELGLVGSVDWLGAVPNAYRIMAGADVFCLPSRTEAMPLVVIEAMSQRVPIVATAVGGIGRLAADVEPGRFLIRHNETGLLVPPGRPPALAEALRSALSDRQAARARADRALEEYRRSFTADCMTQRYLDVFEQLTQRRAPSIRRRSAWVGQHNRPGVLMVGPGPEQIGGMTSVIDALMASSLRERYRLHRFSTTAGTPSEQKHRERRRSIPRVAQKLPGIARHIVALCQLARTIRRARISVVHVHTCSFFSFYRSLLDSAVAKLLGCRVYLHVHGSEFREFCAASKYCGRWLIRRGCETADAVIVLSRCWVDTLRPFLGSARLAAIPNGIEPVLNTPKRRPHSRSLCRFLFLGALTERKGLPELIGAAATLRQRAVPFELIIAGPATQPERKRWEQAVRAASLEGLVRLTGPVQGRAKADLLASADCFVLPSHNEGLPIAILEAATAGLPVIATTVGSIPEFMTADGNALKRGDAHYLSPLVPPRDPQTLAREMSRLAGDPRLRETIGARLQAHVTADYSVERQAQRIARLYGDIPARRLPRRYGAAGWSSAPPSVPASQLPQSHRQTVSSTPPTDDAALAGARS